MSEIGYFIPSRIIHRLGVEDHINVGYIGLELCMSTGTEGLVSLLGFDEAMAISLIYIPYIPSDGCRYCKKTKE